MLKTAAPGPCQHVRMTYTSDKTRDDGGCFSTETPQTTQAQDAFGDELLGQLPHLRNYALSLTQDPAEASDLVQDCVLKALEKRHQYTEDTYMRRWLFTILRNRYLDQWRQRSRRGPQVPVEDCPQASLSRPASQDDWMELRSCQQELGKLGPCDRAILLLSVFSPLSHKEIAAALDVAEGTVRSRLSRTRAQLRA